MSLYSALRSSVSSIQANSAHISMISNNISNSNTVGYKRVNASFSTFVSENYENLNFSAGGVRANTLRDITQQGDLTSTGNQTDMAISGNGYFAVTKYITEDSNGDWSANAEVLFTRRGDFTEDVNGNLQNVDGHYLLAWPQNSSANGINDSSSIDDFKAVNIGNQRIEPIASSEIKIAVNITPETLSSESFSVQYEFLDGRGNPYPAELTFQKIPAEISTVHFSAAGNAIDKTVETSVPNGWRVYASFTDNDAVGFRQYDETGADIGVATGEDVPIADVIFDSTGRLSNIALPGTMSFYRQTELPIIDDRLPGSRQLIETGSIASAPIQLTSISLDGKAELRRILIEAGVPDTTFTFPFTDDNELIAAIDVLDTRNFPDAMSQIVKVINDEVPFENTVGRQDAGYALLNDGIDDMTQYWRRGDVPGEFARGRTSGEKYMVSRLINGETGTLEPPLDGTDNLPGFSRHSYNKVAITVDYDGDPTASGEERQIILDFGSMNLNSLTAGDSLNRSAVSVPISSNIGTGDDGITQFSDTVSTVRNLENNGRASSLLTNVIITNDGLVTGLFSNGQQRSLAQVPLVIFANPNALLPAEGLSYSRTEETGTPLVRLANSAEAGRVVGSFTESSSVDLAQEFSEMIVSQRGFSASAKVVSTTQAMIDELSQRL